MRSAGRAHQGHGQPFIHSFRSCGACAERAAPVSGHMTPPVGRGGGLCIPPRDELNPSPSVTSVNRRFPEVCNRAEWHVIQSYRTVMSKWRESTTDSHSVAFVAIICFRSNVWEVVAPRSGLGPRISMKYLYSQQWQKGRERYTDVSANGKSHL